MSDTGSMDPDETDAGSSPHTEIAKDLPVEDYFRREEPDVDPRDFVSVFRRFMREQYYTQQDVARQLCCSQAKLSTFLCRKLSPKSFEKTMQMIETWIATTDHQAEYNQRKEKAFHCLLSKRTSKANQSALVFDRFPVDLMRGDGGRYRRPKRKEYAKRPKVKKTKSVEVSTLETNSALLHPSKRVKLALAPKPTGGLSISPILQANTCSQASPVMSAHRYPTQRPPLEPHVHADREGGDGFCSLTVADNIDPLIDTGSLPDNLPQLHYDTYEGCDGLYGVVGLEGDMQDPCSPYLCSVSSALPPVWYGEAETDRAPTTDTLLAGRIPHTHDFDTGDCTLDADTSLHGLWELFSQSPELRNTALPWEAGVCDASGYSSSECLLGDCNLDDAPSQTTNTF